MLSFYTPGQHPLREELKLKYWQGILGLTRLALRAQQWAHLFAQHRKLMALSFLTGVLIGLLPLLK